MTNVVIMKDKLDARVESESQGHDGGLEAKSNGAAGFKGFVGGLKRQLFTSKPATADFCREEAMPERYVEGKAVVSVAAELLPDGMSEESATEILKAMLAMDMASRHGASVMQNKMDDRHDESLSEQMELF